MQARTKTGGMLHKGLHGQDHHGVLGLPRIPVVEHVVRIVRKVARTGVSVISTTETDAAGRRLLAGSLEPAYIAEVAIHIQGYNVK